MDLLLIKIGKAWHTIRREGLIRGSRRVFGTLQSMFRRVRPGDILFISGGVGDSARYRCDHVAEEFELQGFRTAVTIQDNPFLLSYADKFSVFVFHRVLFTDQVRAFIDRLKSLKKEIIFETDDLVYDPAFLVHMDYFQKMNAFERKLYENGVGGEILADPYVKVATTTTSFLAEKLREKGKKVFIMPNKLAQEDIRIAETALQLASKQDNVVRIGYLSGTRSHNKDFSTITGALIQIFEKYPEVRLVLTGPIDTDEVLEKYADRIERIPFMPRSKLFRHIAGLDINIAPLELDNPFCESKSELKFFEAGIVVVPTVAVANQTFREAIQDGVNGFVASGMDEWVGKLRKLIEDEDLRNALGEAARQTALSRYATNARWNTEYMDFIRNTIHKK